MCDLDSSHVQGKIQVRNPNFDRASFCLQWYPNDMPEPHKFGVRCSIWGEHDATYDEIDDPEEYKCLFSMNWMWHEWQKSKLYHAIVDPECRAVMDENFEWNRKRNSLFLPDARFLVPHDKIIGYKYWATQPGARIEYIFQGTILERVRPEFSLRDISRSSCMLSSFIEFTGGTTFHISKRWGSKTFDFTRFLAENKFDCKMWWSRDGKRTFGARSFQIINGILVGLHPADAYRQTASIKIDRIFSGCESTYGGGDGFETQYKMKLVNMKTNEAMWREIEKEMVFESW